MSEKRVRLRYYVPKPIEFTTIVSEDEMVRRFRDMFGVSAEDARTAFRAWAEEEIAKQKKEQRELEKQRRRGTKRKYRPRKR